MTTTDLRHRIDAAWTLLRADSLRMTQEGLGTMTPIERAFLRDKLTDLRAELDRRIRGGFHPGGHRV